MTTAPIPSGQPNPAAPALVMPYRGRQPRYTMMVGKRWIPKKLTGQ